MSDKDHIIRLLESAERRMRRNRILKDSASGLAIAMVVPVVFKLIDLISPFRGITVFAFLALWAAATIGWLAWRARGRDTLERTAAKVDQAAGAHDQIKTAYWF